ncbi:MAG: Asp-tRNA(Asn)/Glu-tRNA(Gln) amidotransferase subunit GatB [Elusimicrobia bacterium]|nr:Asp-tRNA(Asn)/Glu-tRNA(Gln) amidotransferase subunit GatB [Candidatus Obscuribacterium magneticum]MCB4755863.1 Asp-tRNA(Asn)/Glu-tRNA(Gln) amidotransferase subunit GatB [Candidatus Obscuribacterium magneticum]
MAEAGSTKTTYEAVIGLEVHVQVKTDSKLFCSCPTAFGSPPNSQVCPVCTGQPGVLPVLNKKALEGAIKVGLAIGCTVNKKCFFARKQYFYPDLPKAYQISQSDKPLCVDGKIDIDTEGGRKTVRVQRLHMEEDAGKLLHAIGSTELPYSLVDLNRSGIPLIEIVSHPDLSSVEEAHAYLTTLKAIVQFVGVSDCDMEKGSLRCDANVSIRPKGETKLGTKVEIKNMNSFRAVKDALTYEIKRQEEAVESGGRLVQETRLWNEAQGTTASMRSKEEAHDYRYFPEPDLVPLDLSAAWLEEIRSSLPELPGARKERLMRDFGLNDYDAGVLVGQRELVEYFEAGLQSWPMAKRKTMAKPLANWVITELLGRLNEQNKSVAESPVAAASLAELVELIQSGTLSGKMGKDVFAEIYASGESPQAVVKRKGLSQVSNESELLKFIDEVLQENPKIVQDVKGGKDRAIGSLVGALMKKTQGRANPQMANDLLRKRILGQ